MNAVWVHEIFIVYYSYRGGVEEYVAVKRQGKNKASSHV